MDSNSCSLRNIDDKRERREEIKRNFFGGNSGEKKMFPFVFLMVVQLQCYGLCPYSGPLTLLQVNDLSNQRRWSKTPEWKVSYLMNAHHKERERKYTWGSNFSDWRWLPQQKNNCISKSSFKTWHVPRSFTKIFVKL